MVVHQRLEIAAAVLVCEKAGVLATNGLGAGVGGVGVSLSEGAKGLGECTGVVYGLHDGGYDYWGELARDSGLVGDSENGWEENGETGHWCGSASI